MSIAEQNMYRDEPTTRWGVDDFREFVVWASRKGASDIKLAPRNPIWVRVDGAWAAATRRQCFHDEIATIVNAAARANDAADQAVSGPGYPFEYEVVYGGIHAGAKDFDPYHDTAQRFRYRAEATGCRDGLGSSIELTLRSLPDLPPTVIDLGTPQEIIDHCTPTNGLILIAGTMGSGKSTSLAAILRHINENLPWSIATFEQPIEFDLSAIPHPVGPVAQSEIPRQFESFRLAARNATRRAADVVLIGESRDSETVASMLEAAEIGSVVFSTIHTRSVAETPDRLINIFPEDERPAVAVRFATAIRLVIYQRLVSRIDPVTGEKKGRIPLIEYLPITSDLNSKLSAADMGDYRGILREALEEGRGRSLAAHATELYEQGLIERAAFEAATREAKHVA